MAGSRGRDVVLLVIMLDAVVVGCQGNMFHRPQVERQDHRLPTMSTMP